MTYNNQILIIILYNNAEACILSTLTSWSNAWWELGRDSSADPTMDLIEFLITSRFPRCCGLCAGLTCRNTW